MSLIFRVLIFKTRMVSTISKVYNSSLQAQAVRKKSRGWIICRFLPNWDQWTMIEEDSYQPSLKDTLPNSSSRVVKTHSSPPKTAKRTRRLLLHHSNKSRNYHNWVNWAHFRQWVAKRMRLKNKGFQLRLSKFKTTIKISLGALEFVNLRIGSNTENEKTVRETRAQTKDTTKMSNTSKFLTKD